MKKLFILFILLFLVSSCKITLSYKSSKIRKSHTKIYKQVQKLSHSMEQDYKKRKNIYDSLNIEYNNYLAEKYSKIQKVLNKMARIVKKVKKEENIALKLKNEVYKITKNRKKIKSDKPEWDKYDVIRDRTKDMESRLEDLNEKYQDLSEDYNNLIRKAGVKEVNSKKIKKQFEKNSKKLKNTVRIFRNKVNKLLEKYKNNSDKSEKLVKIKELLSKITEKWDNTNKAIKSFTKRLKGKKKIYIIEKSDGVIKRIRKSYDEINEIGMEINKISKTL